MITIELKDDEISAVLNRLAAAVTDMSEPMRHIGDDWLVSTQDRVKAGLDPEGAPFAPRSQTTIVRYQKLGLTYGKPLYQSGEMISQIAFASGPDFVEIGSNAIQAAVMQFGAQQGQFGAFIGKDVKGRDHFHSIPWGNIPARPFLGLSEEDRSDIVATVSEWLMKSANG